MLHAMRSHVSLEHLLAVADYDNLLLTTEEFNHLTTCPECFTAWAEFIRESVLEEQMDGQFMWQRPALSKAFHAPVWELSGVE